MNNIAAFLIGLAVGGILGTVVLAKAALWYYKKKFVGAWTSEQ